MTTKAVMFCIMDVSGSMTQAKKLKAKEYFDMLYAPIQQQYADTLRIFIKHYTHASITDEHTFYHGHETGGTIVSSALKLLRDEIDEALEANYDIYVAQATDGDNWSDDTEECKTILNWDILPFVRQYAYIEMPHSPDEHQDLWHGMQEVSSMPGNTHLLIVNINGA